MISAVSTPRLTDRVAVVTGGARGIGGAIAAAMAAEGADVAIADVLPESAAEPVLDAIARTGRRAIYVHTDVTDAAQVEAMVGARPGRVRAHRHARQQRRRGRAVPVPRADRRDTTA
jgi:NAD(P)-dependent dehydrogenase (short-subunit alcohol dehydrogenase family)